MPNLAGGSQRVLASRHLRSRLLVSPPPSTHLCSCHLATCSSYLVGWQHSKSPKCRICISGTPMAVTGLLWLLCCRPFSEAPARRQLRGGYTTFHSTACGCSCGGTPPYAAAAPHAPVVHWHARPAARMHGPCRQRTEAMHAELESVK